LKMHKSEINNSNKVSHQEKQKYTRLSLGIVTNSISRMAQYNIALVFLEYIQLLQYSIFNDSSK
jgi:hypothetical protein